MSFSQELIEQLAVMNELLFQTENLYEAAGDSEQAQNAKALRNYLDTIRSKLTKKRRPNALPDLSGVTRLIQRDNEQLQIALTESQTSSAVVAKLSTALDSTLKVLAALSQVID